MRNTLAKALATCGGIGFAPLAPGTVASLVIALLYKLFLFRLAWPLLLILFLVLFFFGIKASAVLSTNLRHSDPRRIVIDEVCGQLIALLALPPTWVAVGLSFFLFRLFDIIKPFPIRRSEKLAGGWGIMVDDGLAGLMARLLLLILWPFINTMP